MLRLAANNLLRISKDTIPWRQNPLHESCVFGQNYFSTKHPSPQAGDVGTVLKAAERQNFAAFTACDIVITLAGLKKINKMSEPEFLLAMMEDQRFLKVMKVLESNQTAQLEPLAIISSLKVRLIEI